MIRVENKRKYSGPGEYVGRPSTLGNPYSERIHGRDGCIKMYKTWFKGQISSGPGRRELDRLTEIARKRDLVLICWCAPLACHGDVIKAEIERRL